MPAYVRLTQRSRPRRDRRRMWALLVLVLAAHVLLVWLGWLILGPMHPHGSREVMMVTLIEPSPHRPPLPLPPPGLPPAAPVRAEPPAEGAIQATLGDATQGKLDLYDSNGRIRLPSSGAQKPAPAPAYSTPALEGSDVYGGTSPLPYKPTRFNDDWAPANQSLGAQTVGRAFDKAVDKTTVQKTVKLPGGIRLHCVVSPLLLVFGCPTEAPPPPPANDDDIRLSMPPPETLTGDKVPLPQSASSVPPSASSGVR